MALQSNSERVAVRLAPYIGELQEFFTSRSMRFGSSEHLAPIALLLSVPGSFQDEMASMIRSIIYREQGTVPHGELLELVTVAIGGPHVDEASPELYEPVRRLLAFISSVLRSKRSPSFDDSKADSQAPQRAVEQPFVASSISQHETLEDSTLAWADSISRERQVATQSNPVSSGKSGSTAAKRSNPEVYFRASAILSDPRVPALGGHSVPSAPVIDLADANPTQVAADLVPVPVAKHSVRHNFSWAIALGLIPIFLFINMYLNHRSAPSRAPQTRTASGTSAVEETASQPATPASGSAAVALSPAAPSPDTPARQPYPGPASQPYSSAVARQESTASLPGHSFAKASPVNDLLTPAPDVVAYSRPPAIQPSRPAVPGGGGSSARVHPYGHRGSSAVSSGVMAGNLVSAPVPKYPRLASFAHVEGQVILQAVVSRDGSVVDTRIIRGPRLLRGAATQAVRRWRYRPYVLNGRTTDVATIVTVDFRLHE